MLSRIRSAPWPRPSPYWRVYPCRLPPGRGMFCPPGCPGTGRACSTSSSPMGMFCGGSCPRGRGSRSVPRTVRVLRIGRAVRRWTAGRHMAALRLERRRAVVPRVGVLRLVVLWIGVLRLVALREVGRRPSASSPSTPRIRRWPPWSVRSSPMGISGMPTRGPPVLRALESPATGARGTCPHTYPQRSCGVWPPPRPSRRCVRPSGRRLPYDPAVSPAGAAAGARPAWREPQRSP